MNKNEYKLFLNSPTGKFSKKEIIEEKQFFINDKVENIYNADDKSVFGKWKHEVTSRRFIYNVKKYLITLLVDGYFKELTEVKENITS